MTAGNDGASTPEDDDPFGYLYADGQASGATPPSGGGGYGYPGQRSSYNQVRAVGERQYGQQAPGGARGGYGYPPVQGQGRPGGYDQSGGQGQTAAFGQVPPPGGYRQPNAHYQAPETLPGGPQGPRQGPGPGYDGGGGRGRGPNTKGLLIGAIAVVAAVVIGIGVAMISSSDSKGGGSQAGTAPSTSGAAQPSDTATTNQGTQSAALPKTDAKALKLEGGTATSSDVKGAKADGGVYVSGLNQPGAAVTWTVDGIPKSGKYTLDIGYGVPGTDASMTLTVNGKPGTSPLSLKNWAGAPAGDWEKGWTSSYTYIQLNKGTNTLKISCEQGDQCNVNLDQVWLQNGWVKSGN